jgi:hemolysin III
MTKAREAAPVSDASLPRAPFTVGEELVHALSHGVGALLAVVGAIALVLDASARGGLYVVGCAIYGATLITLFLASTACHAVPMDMPRTRTWLQRVDHGAIYLQIAGTYTPFSLFVIPAPWGPRLLVAIWVLAAIGLLNTAHSLFTGVEGSRERAYRRRSLALYLLMGWLAVVAFKPLVQALPAGPLALVLVGGAAYSVGVGFFVSRRKWSHSVWHGFVLAGAAAHFGALFLLV